MRKKILWLFLSSATCLFAGQEKSREFFFNPDPLWGSQLFLNQTKYDWEDPLVCVISTPRSGIHWLLYSVSALSNHAILQDSCLNNAVEGPYDPNKKPILGYHQIKDKPVNINRDKLIVITRNHRDSILRHFNVDYDKAIASLDDILQKRENFPLPVGICIYQLEIFDQWDPEKRLLIYYEDLIKYPEKVLTAVMNFMGETDWSIAQYLEQIEKHQNYCKSMYQGRPYGATYSDGKNTHPYSSLFSEEKLCKLDEKVRLLNPLIYDKYCSANIKEQK